MWIKCYTLLYMGSEQINFRPTEEDLKIFMVLRDDMGVGNSQIIRLALRALMKERVALAEKATKSKTK